jgi:hypothetical protein
MGAGLARALVGLALKVAFAVVRELVGPALRVALVVRGVVGLALRAA